MEEAGEMCCGLRAHFNTLPLLKVQPEEHALQPCEDRFTTVNNELANRHTALCNDSSPSKHGCVRRSNDDISETGRSELRHVREPGLAMRTVAGLGIGQM